MAIEKGTKVVIISGGTTAASTGDYHGFKIGSEVTALGKVYDFNPEWELFIDEHQATSWLKASHYELVKAPVVEDELLDKVVDSDLPSKVVYAIVNKDNEIVSCRVDRDKARETKALMGGKKKGVRIFQYAAVKEIR